MFLAVKGKKMMSENRENMFKNDMGCGVGVGESE